MAPTELARAYEAVVLDPNADGPRLAYAAACDAIGDHERADFIRVQLAQRDYLRSGGTILHGNMPGIRQERDLQKKYGAQWAGAIAQRVQWYLFYGGFVEQIQIDAGKFLATADELYGLAPIRRLSLTGVVPVLDELLRSSHLERLVSLHIESQNLGDRGVEALATCPHLAKLEWLGLFGNQLTIAAVESLARSDKFPALRNIELLGNPVAKEVDERIGDDQGDIVAIEEGLFAIEKRFGRKTWLHPVLDHGARYFEQQEL